MLVKAEFNIDLVQLKHTSDKDGMLRSYRHQSAKELGFKLAELFPFEKDEDASFKGEVPEVAFTKDHQFVDKYRLNLCVFKDKELDAVIEMLRIGLISKAIEILQS